MRKVGIMGQGRMGEIKVELREIGIQLVTAFFGVLGFSIVFRIRAKLLPFAAFGGVGSRAVYLCALNLGEGIFISCLLAASLAAFYAEVFARILKAPAALFSTPAAIPLVPGSNLYYAMSYAVREQWKKAGDYGLLTAKYALAIAAGVSLIGAFFVIAANIKEKHYREL